MKKTEKISIALLGKILTVILMVLICCISFGGIYVADKNKTKNLVEDYKLGNDLYGSRNIVIKVSNKDSESTSNNNNDENEESNNEGQNTTSEENVEENAETENNEDVNTEQEKNTSLENYLKTKKIIEQRLKYMGVDDYTIRLNKDDGTISLEVPENSTTDYVAQYCITPGVFEISDAETKEQLIGNSDIKEAKVGYYTEANGTAVYLTIRFNKEGTEKLANISKTYIKSQDVDGNDTTKKIDMKIDDETILSSYFDEEITDGVIQMSLGTSSDASTIRTYLEQASNIAVLLNTESMPISYEIDVNRFVYSDTEFNNQLVLPIICIVIAIISGIYMIIRYKKLGILGIIEILGFSAILLLAIRVGNVELTISGIFAVGLMTVIEAIMVFYMQKAYKEGISKEMIRKNMMELLKKTILIVIPLVIIAITFAFSSYSVITSIGMIIFWSVMIMVIYNILVLGGIMFNPIDNKKD